MFNFKIGQFEFIRNNGAMSLIYKNVERQFILNVKPTPGEPQELLVQLFVIKNPEEGSLA